MTFMVSPEPPESGPDDLDPLRRANDRTVRDLAFRLEMEVQYGEVVDAQFQAVKARVTALETAVATLEALIIGTAS